MLVLWEQICRVMSLTYDDSTFAGRCLPRREEGNGQGKLLEQET